MIVEYYAFDAGKRCKEKAKDVYRILGKVGIRVFSLSVTGHNLEVKETVKQEPKVISPGTVQDHVEGLKALFELMNVTSDYIPGLVAEGIKEAHPQLAGTVETGKILMASNAENDIKNQSFTVTEIGEKLAIKFSAVKLNKILSQMGYQVKENKRWVLTELGKENGGVVIATTKKGKKDNVEQIRWKEEIIDKINEYLEN